MTAVHQFVATFEPGAIGHHMIEAQRALRSAGFESEIFTEFWAPGWEDKARSFRDFGRSYPASSDDRVIYQFAIGSNVGDFFSDLPQTKILDYHNLTPPEFFVGWEPDVVPGIQWGRKQLSEMADCCEVGLADSAFNEAELQHFNYRKTAVAPIILNFDDLGMTPDAKRMGELKDSKQAGGIDILFVGRIAPNKCQHDLIKILAAYHDGYDREARLHIVGGWSAQRYKEALTDFAEAAGVASKCNIVQHASRAELMAYYQNADVYVSASEHEGFCVPLVEAMYHDVPIVAFASSAVPETLADAGILLDEKSPELFAAAIHRVVTDNELRKSLHKAAQRRLAEFAPQQTAQKFLDGVALAET